MRSIWEPNLACCWRCTVGAGQLVFHPYVHCLVTGGGVRPTGQWVSVRNGYLLPVHVVTALCRGTFVGGLRRLWRRGDLKLPKEMREQSFLNLLNRLGHTKKTRWNVHIRERYPHGEGVATYVARSMRGGALKNRQLVGFDGEHVTFGYRDHRDTSSGGSLKRHMTLPVAVFIGRLLQHVVAVKTQGVRRYGLYHASKAEVFARLRGELRQETEEGCEEASWQAVCARLGDLHPESCPVCGERLVCTGTVARRGGIDPSEGAIGRVA